MTPARQIALGFFAVILAGAVLLMLPFASKSGATGFLDALFTSTSATCVTGLVVADTFTHWTLFGQIVILCLIQLGGLGFMTVISLVSFALGKRLGLYDRKVLMQSTGNISLAGIGGLIRRIVPLSFVLELLGACLLMIRFVPDFGWGQGLYFSIFHSVSAFCNAGFDLMGGRAPFSSLTAYGADPLVLLTLSALVIIGGLGFFVWRDIMHNGFHFSHYQLHTKLVLVSTAVLLVGGWALFLLFERNASLAGMSLPEQVLSSFFLSVTPRTAGFNAVDTAAMSESGNLLTNIFMLIGGSPGSTAGGIKTTTAAILLLNTISSARGLTRVNAFRFAIDRATLKQASSILLIYLGMSLTAALALCAIDPVSLKEGLFEVNSAIGTVGLSLGITPTLSAWSHVILILLMYAGRIGGLTFVLLFSEKRKEPPLDRPDGKLLIG